MGYRVTFSARAERDLEGVARFLAAKNPQAAERLGNAIVDDTVALAQMPSRGLAVKDRPGYRRILHRPYFVIFYRVDEAKAVVEIARIWDARQDPRRFALE
jgi:plasmid stabilization system protein ParE